ncbi:hypothetical protein Tco_0729596 [Tanacetum coccineum]|uniref:Uncharacterized protein n=1 Tax=Tanacetum coccineum TaxID=301880 RepID=A0ABQ4YQ99_9ASTR
MVSLLEAANVFEKAKAEGEKVSLKEDIALELAEEAKIIPDPMNAEKAMAEPQGELSNEQTPPDTKQISLVSSAMIVYSSRDKPAEEEPPFKKLKFLIPDPSVPSPIPLSSIPSQDFKQPVMANLFIEQFTDTTEEDPIKQLIPLLEQSGSDPKTLDLHKFNIPVKMLGFSEWIELHALASSSNTKANNLLLKILKAKFQWLRTQAGKLRITYPPQLADFDLPIGWNAEEFYSLSRGCWIRRVGDIRLIRIQNSIKTNSEVAEEMFRKMILTIKARDDVVEAMRIGEIDGPIKDPVVSA